MKPNFASVGNAGSAYIRSLASKDCDVTSPSLEDHLMLFLAIPDQVSTLKHGVALLKLDVDQQSLALELDFATKRYVS